MTKGKKAITDAAVDPVSFKLPEWLDAIVRDKTVVGKRSEFLRRCIGVGIIALTDDIVCGSDIARMVMAEMIEPSDIILLVKAESLTEEYVMALIDEALITGVYARDIKLGLQQLSNPGRSRQDKDVLRRRAQKTSSQRRLV